MQPMGQPLKFNHRLRIDVLKSKQNFPKLDAYLNKIAEKGFDVAHVPFTLLDDILSNGTRVDLETLAPLARHTLGGQPRLFQAIVDTMASGSHTALDHIAADGGAHPMTRFEAMGWAVFLAHQASFPDTGPPATQVFQFWDHPEPPVEIQHGKAQWQRTAHTHVWYDDTSAHDYIAQGFGETAAANYARLWHPAVKSDVFRLYRLAQDGGVYCDADSDPGFRASAFLRHAGGRVWASAMTNVPNCVTTNGFIVAPPEHPLILGLLEYVLDNIANAGARGIFWLSGPGAVTSFLYRNSDQYDVGLLPQGCLKTQIFKQFDAPYKHTDKNWRVYEHAAGLNNDAGLAAALAQNIT
jgi:phage terminase large subunit-like protein